jgi:hypothetical protein
MIDTQQAERPEQISSAEADLALIRKMMLQAQNSAALDGRYLVLWGIVLALPQIFMWVAGVVSEGVSDSSQIYIWLAALAIGIAGSILLTVLHKRGPVNLGVRLYSSVWIGFCVTMCLLFIIAIAGQESLLFSLVIIAPAITGLAFFATAAIINLSWLRWVALGWWLMAVLVAVVDGSSYVGLIYIVAYIGLMAGPGLAMMQLGKKA